MYTTIPTSRRVDRTPYFLALLGTIALIAVLALVRTTGGANESSSQSFRPLAIPSPAAHQTGQVTFLLVASEDDAQLLRYRIGEAALDSSMSTISGSNEELVVYVAGTPEDAEGLFAALSAATDGSFAGPSVNVVDLRP